MNQQKITASDSSKNPAIVIGGSIAGMLAARVLADHFENVIIIETDKLPDYPSIRKGVAQSVQPHVLFTKGYRILEELFPGISTSLSAAGAISIDWAKEFHYFTDARWNANNSDDSDIVSVTCSRPLIEWAIRQKLTQFSNVQFLEQHRVTGLLTNPNKTAITGVCLHSLVDKTSNSMPASLVVDAAGRRSNAPQWLESLGFTPPPETIINPFLGYATRRYRQPEGFTSDWKVLLISQQPPTNTRLGYLAKIENGEWIATLGGYGRDFPPTDEAGFLEYASTLASPKFYEAIQNAQPISPIYAHRATANRMRHYEKIKLPLGFVALGDAVCALCPVYGQGMTVSALSAIVLRDWLKTSQNSKTLALGNPVNFQKNLAKSNQLSWMLATSQDSRFPTTAGKNEPGMLGSMLGGVLGWYMQQLQVMASEQASIQTMFMEVAHLLKSPIVLYHPKLILRVLARSLTSVNQ